MTVIIDPISYELKTEEISEPEFKGYQTTVTFRKYPGEIIKFIHREESGKQLWLDGFLAGARWGSLHDEIFEPIEIHKITGVLDGGTKTITTEKYGELCIDGRINSKTIGMLYDGYPKDDNSNLMDIDPDFEYRFAKSVKLYIASRYKNMARGRRK